MHPNDTIAAISSAVGGAAARVIVRMSGPDARSIAQLGCDVPESGGATYTPLRFADLTVPAWVYRFAAGRSYTGDELIEFHLPGSALLARLLLDALIEMGARQADPGEFTARAYFSGRLDLSEAEGVAATIAAHSEQQLRAARQLLAGELSRRLRPMLDLLAESLALLEAGIDFSDEDISFISADQILSRIQQLDRDLDDLVSGSARFEQLTHEPTFVLVGRPNAGKSTLLNALAGHERAVVSSVSGTTRDVLSAEVHLPRGIVRLTDVAGLDASSVTTQIGRRMMEQAMRAAEATDYVILVRAADDPNPPLQLSRPQDLVVLTKSDLLDRPEASIGGDVIVSARNGTGLEELRSRLDGLAFGRGSGGATLALNTRHLGSINACREALARARSIARSAGAELIALELREALNALGEVLGQVTPDDVLGRVFATFCIGK